MTPALARRLALGRQHLTGPPPAAGPEAIMSVATDLRRQTARVWRSAVS